MDFDQKLFDQKCTQYKKKYVINMKNRLKITGKFLINGCINSVSKGE